MNIRELIPENEREKRSGRIRQLSHGEVLEPYRMQRIAKDGRIVEARVTSTALLNEAGKVYAVTTTEREIQMKKAIV